MFSDISHFHNSFITKLASKWFDSLISLTLKSLRECADQLTNLSKFIENGSWIRDSSFPGI